MPHADNAAVAAPIVAEFANERIRETYHGNYRIIYEIDDERVTILRVFHGARQLPDRISDGDST